MNSPNKKTGNEFYIYILLLANGNFYTGWTTDLERRTLEHMTGRKGAKLTKAFKAVSVAASWKIKGSRSDALKIEAFIKKQSRIKKEEMVSDPDELARYYSEKTGIDLEMGVKKKGRPKAPR